MGLHGWVGGIASWSQWRPLNIPGTHLPYSMIQLLIHFCTKLRNLVEKNDRSKKNRGHQTSKIAKSRQSCNNGHLPYYCSFYYLHVAHKSNAWYGMACEFAWDCAIRMCRNRANALNLSII